MMLRIATYPAMMFPAGEKGPTPWDRPTWIKTTSAIVIARKQTVPVKNNILAFWCQVPLRRGKNVNRKAKKTGRTPRELGLRAPVLTRLSR
jgi:hypothetical protein